LLYVVVVLTVAVVDSPPLTVAEVGDTADADGPCEALKWSHRSVWRWATTQYFTAASAAS
jgi:hypothetical protein